MCDQQQVVTGLNIFKAKGPILPAAGIMYQGRIRQQQGYCGKETVLILGSIPQPAPEDGLSLHRVLRQGKKKNGNDRQAFPDNIRQYGFPLMHT